MFLTAENVREGLSLAGLGEAEDVIGPLVLPAVALVATSDGLRELDGNEVDASPIGETKLFGQPDAFEGFQWPMHHQPAPEAPARGMPPRVKPRSWGMNLYAQISLRDLQRFDTDVELPSEGLLLFFSSGQFGAVYYLPPGMPLVRQRFPEPGRFDVLARPAPLEVDLQQMVTLPHPDGPELIQQRSAPWHSRYQTWYHAQTLGVRSWIGGHPYWWQGDPRLTAESRASASSPETYDDLLVHARRNWQLLLQIGDDVDVNRISWWMRPRGENASVFSRCQTDCCFG